MRLDKFTVRNLELRQPLNDGGRSLLDVLDHTTTPMGARLLHRWMLFPLRDTTQINHRLDVVDYYFRHPEFREFIAEQLQVIGDLERITSKVAVGRVSPRDIVQLRVALQAIEPIKKVCMETDDDTLRGIGEQLNLCASIRDRIAREVQPDPPLQVQKGNVIAKGVNA